MHTWGRAHASCVCVCVCTSASMAAALQQRDVSPLCLVSVNVCMSSQAWSCDRSAPPTSTSFHPPPTSSPVACPPTLTPKPSTLWILFAPLSGESPLAYGIFILIPGQNLSITGRPTAGGDLGGSAGVAGGVREDICAQQAPHRHPPPSPALTYSTVCRYHVCADAVTRF